MEKKPMYAVTFRNSDDKLTSMFLEKYETLKEAKAAIEFDAMFFVNKHSNKELGVTGFAFRQFKRWKDPKALDYYEAQGQDGTRCVWQYFKI